MEEFASYRSFQSNLERWPRKFPYGDCLHLSLRPRNGFSRRDTGKFSGGPGLVAKLVEVTVLYSEGVNVKMKCTYKLQFYIYILQPLPHQIDNNYYVYIFIYIYFFFEWVTFIIFSRAKFISQSVPALIHKSSTTIPISEMRTSVRVSQTLLTILSYNT